MHVRPLERRDEQPLSSLFLLAELTHAPFDTFSTPDCVRRAKLRRVQYFLLPFSEFVVWNYSTTYQDYTLLLTSHTKHPPNDHILPPQGYSTQMPQCRGPNNSSGTSTTLEAFHAKTDYADGATMENARIILPPPGSPANRLIFLVEMSARNQLHDIEVGTVLRVFQGRRHRAASRNKKVGGPPAPPYQLRR